MTHLPDEILFRISEFLYPEDIAKASATGKQWHRLFNHQAIWKEKLKKHFPSECQEFPSSPHDAHINYRQRFDECMRYLILNLDNDEETLRYVMALAERDWFQLERMNITSDKLIDTDYGDCHPLKIIASSENSAFKSSLYQNISQSFQDAVTGHIDTQKKDENGLTILFWAIVLDQDFEKVILPLVSAGSSFDEKWLFPGFGPAHIAVLHENVNILNKLLTRDPAIFFQKTVLGRTPLWTAVAAGSVNALKGLLDFAKMHGIDKDAILYRNDILFKAIQSRSLEMVRLICQLYPQLINLPDRTGEPPLFNAVYLRLIKIAEWLLSVGADPEQSCQVAERQEMNEVTQIIRQLRQNRKRRIPHDHLFNPAKKARQEKTDNDATCKTPTRNRP